MSEDLEGGEPTEPLTGQKSLKRKWNQLPRFIKFYVSITVIAVTFVFLMFFFKSNNNKHVKESSTVNVVNVETSRKFDVHFERPNYFKNDISPGDEPEKVIENPDAEILDDLPTVSESDELSTADFKRMASKQNAQQEAIIGAMKHSWEGYRKYAWGADHLKPITKGKQNWFGVGLTILDAMDTLLMMGMEKEYDEAIKWLKSDLSFDISREVNCFETTIRCLGGLLSAYHLTKEPTLLVKAADLGERLIHCFDTPSQVVPYSDVNLRTKLPKAPTWSVDSSTSEVSTVQLEFRDLTYLTGIKKYETLSFKTSQHIHNLTVIRNDPLLPIYINPHTGQFSRATITLGARGDSYYEYLLKQYLQTGIEWIKDDYVKAVSAIRERLVRETTGPLKLSYIAEILRPYAGRGDINPKMDHLTCFLAGTLALGYYHQVLKVPQIRGHSVGDSQFGDHMYLAEKLTRTCYMMYNLTATGLSPEIAYFGEGLWDQELQIRPADAHNLLRPEFIESLFYMYHITGNKQYREWGWNVFQAFQKYTKVSSGGYTSISDVRNRDNVRPKDMQESFWLGETLKYFYLLFCDDKVVIEKLLNNYIFNTEAHIVPRRIY